MSKKINSIILCLMPLYLMSGGFINMVLFCFGLSAFDNSRRLISIALLIILFCLSLLKLLFLFQDYPQKRKKLVLLCFIPSLWLLIFFVAIYRFGIQHEIITTLIDFGIYCIPAFIIGISIAIERTEEIFIKNFKWYGLIISPLLVYYIVRISISPNLNDSLINLGNIDYLNIGYTLMPILIFCILDLFLHKGKNSWINTFLIILLWIAYLFTGAKGPLLSMLVFLLVFIVYLIFKKQMNKTMFYLFIIMFLILAFLLFINSPPSAGTFRTTMFIEDLENKSIQSANMADADKKLISKLIENATPTHSIQDELLELKQQGNNLPVSLDKVNWDRMFLYKLAITEGNKAPLTGLGPMGYTLKYTMYPHNLILELLADFGYVGMSLFVIIILFLFVLGCKKVKANIFIAYIFIYIISSMVGTMLSGTVYSSVALLFLLGYACPLSKNTEPKQ